MKYAVLLFVALLSTTTVQAVELSSKAPLPMCEKTASADAKLLRFAQNRSPRCCGQCTDTNNRSGCWMQINGRNYCSAC
ncbi:hypothetical protein ABIB85_007506 [Bradyrhizobium sp. JR1.5]